MEENTIYAIIIIGGLINLAILFAVIYYAVNLNNKPIKRLLRILINMKAEELRKQGIDPQKSINAVDELDALVKQLSNAQITKEQFDFHSDKYLV